MLGSFLFQRIISADWVLLISPPPPTFFKEVCRDLKFSSKPTDTLKFEMSIFSANSLALAVNIEPDIGMFLSETDLNHFRVVVSTSLDVDVLVVFSLLVKLLLSFFFSQVEKVLSGTPRSLAIVHLDFSLFDLHDGPVLCFVSFVVLSDNLRLTTLPLNADFALGVVSFDLVIPQH